MQTVVDLFYEAGGGGGSAGAAIAERVAGRQGPRGPLPIGRQRAGLS
jgi:hypothetical protein